VILIERSEIKSEKPGASRTVSPARINATRRGPYPFDSTNEPPQPYDPEAIRAPSLEPRS
jgi:hypothetical protein